MNQSNKTQKATWDSTGVSHYPTSLSKPRTTEPWCWLAPVFN